jgi:hypothetical protein
MVSVSTRSILMSSHGVLVLLFQLESIAALRDSPVEVTFFTSSKQTVVQAAAGADFSLALVKEEPVGEQTTASTSTTHDHQRR